MKTQAIKKLSIRKNDQIQVIAGKEKGRTGKVLRVDSKNGRILVEKINLVKRHVRPTQENPQGGITEKEGYLQYSNVLLFCPKCNRGVRHGIKVETPKKTDKKSKKETGSGVSKYRFCKKCKGSLDLN